MTKLFRRVLIWSEQLTVRVTVSIALTIITFAAVAVLINVREGHDVLFQRLSERTDNLGSLVADLTASHMDETRAPDLKVIVDRILRQRDVALMEIVDLQGKVLAAGGRRQPSPETKANNQIVAPVLATGEKVIVAKPDCLDAAIPIRLGSQLVGAVHLTMSLDSVNASTIRLTSRYVVWGVLLIGFAIPLSALFMVRSTRQIRRVTGAARRIADGDLDFEFEEAAKGEVGELQHAFSHMKKALRDNIAENVRLAYTDSVTGLPNRPAFRRAINSVLKGEPPVGGAVLFLDLDRFKKVNDTFGHDVGDGLLKLVSARLLSFLKGYRSSAEPVIARFGGDEFTILLPGIDSRDGAELLAAQIIELLSGPFILEGQEMVVGASVGITLFPEDGLECDKLLRNADLAMYAAKDGGRQTARSYSPELEQSTVKRLTLEGELRKALANKEFEVFYQPKVSCEDARVVGAEALVRWQHPIRGLLSPAAFLNVAEEAGLIADLSWQVMEQAMMEASGLPAGDHPISLAINVSARQFEQPDFVETVSDILDRSGLDPSLLELELTESIAMREPERVIERITPLKLRGVGFAIDDFGTGYSSLSYLTRLPVDTVKIDRSFIRAARSSVDDKALVTMILSMAKSLNLKTVAEGIESEEDFAFVREHGATLAQGFLFSPPMTYRNFLVFCEKFRRRSGSPIKALGPVPREKWRM
jgi:diguanylate cyclase (GGDEF)-like protein